MFAPPPSPNLRTRRADASFNGMGKLWYGYIDAMDYVRAIHTGVIIIEYGYRDEDYKSSS